jgi:ankyrin repeat protein
MPTAGEPGLTPAQICCMQGHDKCLLLLLDHRADPNLTDRHGRTPAHFACIGGHVKCLRLLLGRGAEINIKSIDGYTPLDIARINKRYKCEELLLENHATGMVEEDLPSLTENQKEQHAEHYLQERTAEAKTTRCSYPVSV